MSEKIIEKKNKQMNMPTEYPNKHRASYNNYEV